MASILTTTGRPRNRPCDDPRMQHATAARILLVGMMGSGKSTVGRLLSEATGWPYVDNDELVRRAQGTTARVLLAERGEEEMRRAESEALELGLRLPPPVIVGVAAGTILEPDDRSRLRVGGIVVWLRASANVLVARAMKGEHRPFLDTHGPDWMASTLAEREPLYRSVADVIVDTGAARPADTAAELRWRLATFAACQAG